MRHPDSSTSRNRRWLPPSLWLALLLPSMLQAAPHRLFVLGEALQPRSHTLPISEPRGPLDSNTRGGGVPEDAYRATLAVRVATLDLTTRRLEHLAGSAVALALEPREPRLWLATSAHVVACPASCHILVDFPMADGSRQGRRAKIQWLERSQDLALLSVRPPDGALFALLPRASQARVGSVDKVIALGFPDTFADSDTLGDSDTLDDSNTLDNSDDATGQRTLAAVRGEVLQRRPRARLAYRAPNTSTLSGTLDLDHLLLHTARIAPGFSGGPLIDRDGRLLGIHTGSLETSAKGDCWRQAHPSGCAYVAVGLEALWHQLERRLPAAAAITTPVLVAPPATVVSPVVAARGPAYRSYK